MQNKTPIMVLTGLGIVAAAAVAGLTRDHWMGQTPQVVATAPEATTAAPEPSKGTTPEAPKSAEQPATAPAPATTEQPATAPAQTAEQPPAEPAKPETAQPAATAQPETAQPETTQQTASAQPEVQPGQPAATNGEAKPEVPTFDTVRVEKTGEAVIAGKADPGAEVVIMLDGAKIGETTANSDGAFVVVPDKPLPAGSGALTIEAKAKGEAVPTPSEQSVAVIVPAADQKQEALVAVVSPDQPTKVLQKPEVKAEEPAAAAPAQTADTGTTATAPAEKPAKLVSIDAVDYDPTGNIVFSGQGEQGNTARVYIDNAFIGDAPVGTDGRWSFSGTAKVAEGVHTLRVDGIDAAGKVLNRVEVPFFREQQSKVADATAAQPAQPAQQDSGTAGTTAPAQQPAADAGQTTQPAAQQPASDTAQTTQPATQPATGTAEQGTSQQSATPATTAEATPAKPKEGRVVIQPGNNLWRISRVLYGSGAKFTTLYEANKDQIRNPNRIYPGQVFRTPDVAPNTGTIDPKRREPLKPEENAVSGQ